MLLCNSGVDTGDDWRSLELDLVKFPGYDNKTLAPVVGFIQYIYSEGKKSNKTLLSIKCAITVDKSITDPFAKYMHWPVQLYHLGLNKSCEQILSEWISGHFVRWDVSSEHMVVLSLSWVSFFSYTISSFWQVCPRIDMLVVLFVNALQSTCLVRDLTIFWRSMRRRRTK